MAGAGAEAAGHGAAPAPVRRVVLVHGLWMPRWSLAWHARRLRAAGFEPELFGYSTVRGGPEAAVPRLAQRLRAPAGVLAHSLGGLVALEALRCNPGLPVARVVCLGSPLCGSAAAGGLSRHRVGQASLGHSCGLLCGGCRRWQGPAAVGMVAGELALGLGQVFGRFEGASDGTVAVAETRLPGLADHVTVHASHSGLLWSAAAAGQALAFLQQGRFRHPR